MIRFGAFEALSTLGQGGMGQVWRGQHPGQAVPVAIKVLSSRVARNPEFRDGFAREVQAMAALDHPGICHIFDYGVIDEEAARQPLAIQEKLIAGDPWLAMELAPHGSLDQQPAMRSWSRLRRCLLEILDALAHAHARGIIHRDLKPGNVLICADSKGVRRYVLTDFGLAHALDPSVSRSTADIHASMAGTPHYMPPEQLQGQWRDYGPWTDLYALGCMAHELACGQPPFHAESFIRLAALHLDAPPPTLDARFQVPIDLEAWIHRLMAKDWSHRFACAADAAWALMQLTLPEHLAGEDEVADGDGALVSMPTFADLAATMEQPLVMGATLVLDSSQIQDLAQSDQHHAAARPARLFDSQLVHDARAARAIASLEPRAASADDMPPLPPTWRASDALERRSPRLIGAGLGLFGLREIPFVGRAVERDQLWEELRQVQQTRQSRVLIVRGPAGTGKTRLVEWITCRAAELGACQIIRANHQTIPGPMHGMTPALQATLHAINLPRKAIFERVRALLIRHAEGAPASRIEDIALTITELVAPGLSDPHDGLPIVSFSSAAERHAALNRFLGHYCHLRPVLLWLDDVQWGEESLSFVESLAAAPTRRPLLIVATAREEALHAAPALLARLDALQRSEAVRTIQLTPLPADEHATLVDDMLALDAQLARQLALRTQGNPLFARQLLSDWVERDLLIHTPTGFALREGAPIALPASIHALWRTRLDHLEAAHPGTALLLEYAATLGQEIQRAELAALCRHAGLRLPANLDDLLIERGLAHRRAGGWAFAHGLLHESLLEIAQAAGRLALHHRQAAEMLAAGPDAARPETLERRGKHLLAAHADEQALSALWAAMVGYHRTSAYTRALGVIDLRDVALDRMGAASDDARRVCGWPYRAELLRFIGKMAESAEWSERAMAATESMPESTPRADALRTRATLLWSQADPHSALKLNLQAQEIYTRLHDHHGLVQAMHGYGWVLLGTRRYKEALEVFERGARLAARIQDLRNEAWCIQGIADMLIRLRQPDRGEEYARRAGALFSAVGSRTGLALAQSTIADAQRQRGQLDQALICYMEARELWRETGSSLMSLASFRIALVKLHQGQARDARTLLGELTAHVHLNNFLLVLGQLLCSLALASHAGDVEEWDACWLQLAHLEQSRMIDHADVVDAMVLCIAHWERHGDAARGAASRKLHDDVSAVLTHIDIG
jgi:eukaryotic-like serine/threonine-protein kinase